MLPDISTMPSRRTKSVIRKQPPSLSPRHLKYTKVSTRVIMYETTIELDEIGSLLQLTLLKDKKKMYFMLYDKEVRQSQELSMTMKQATQVLMYCQNDFRRFVAQMLCVKTGRVTLRDINKVIDRLSQENLAYSQMMRHQHQLDEQPKPEVQKEVAIVDEHLDIEQPAEPKQEEKPADEDEEDHDHSHEHSSDTDSEKPSKIAHSEEEHDHSPDRSEESSVKSVNNN